MPEQLTSKPEALLQPHGWLVYLLLLLSPSLLLANPLEQVKYNHPGLVVDLGVGLWAWPLPMDYDSDGDLDLVVVCPDKPSNGTYFFENPGGDSKMPVFKPAVRISKGMQNVQLSYVKGQPRVLTPGFEYPQFRGRGLEVRQPLTAPTTVHQPRDYGRPDARRNAIRANQWKYVDYNADGHEDLLVGIGDWADYGWDNAYNRQGRWTHGPLHGYVYLLLNQGRPGKPVYAAPVPLQAGGKQVDVFGMPSPNLADFDQDGDLDLLCGEFVDSLTYFENVGTRLKPRYKAGRLLRNQGRPIRLDLCMITPVSVDWDRDGDIDLVIGEEDGRVALLENTGRTADGLPQFLPPRHFKQQADGIKFGALATPCGFDWDGDGDDDVICGNTAGQIAWIENLGQGRWAAPRLLKAAGKQIQIQAGENGSIQGPAEAKWGYTTLTVGDWDHDGLPDIVANSIWGKVIWYRNTGQRGKPRLAAAQPVQVGGTGRTAKPAWNWWDPVAGTLVTQWRTTPVIVDWNQDGLNDLVMLDQEGYLTWWQRTRRDGRLSLLRPVRCFVTPDGKPLRLTTRTAGGSGRRKLAVVDWDGDGRLDLLVNSVNADWYRNLSDHDGQFVLQNQGPLAERRLAGHTSSPTVVDWNQDGRPELLIGAEDGYLYHMPRDPGPK